MIATPATPLIETIQSVVSSWRMLNALKPSKRENEVVDDSRFADTAVEFMQPIVSDSQTDKQEVPSSSSMDPVESVSEILSSTEHVKDLPTNESAPSNDNTDSSVEKFDDHINSESELMSYSFPNDIEEEVWETIPPVIETIQTVVFTDVPTAEELIDNSMSTSITSSFQSNRVTLTDEDEEQSTSDTDTIIVKSQFSEIQVGIIIRKNECSYSRTLDFVN
jgi:hypothetical protein